MVYSKDERWSSTTATIEQLPGKSEIRIQIKGQIQKERYIEIIALFQTLSKTLEMFNNTAKNHPDTEEQKTKSKRERKKISNREFISKDV